MKKTGYRWWPIIVACVVLLTIPVVYYGMTRRAETIADDEILLLEVGLPPIPSEEAVWVSVYDEEQQLLAQREAVTSPNGMLVRLKGSTYKEMASAQALHLGSDNRPLGDAIPVELVRYPGVAPDEIYRPGKTEKETFLYKNQEIPVYKKTEKTHLSRGDFRWSEAHPDRLDYLGHAYTTEFGIDVSAHQNRAGKQDVIDWEKVAADGVSFVMVRAGLRGTASGIMYEDSYFRQNVEGAMAAGLDTGVYFFSQAITVEEALEEADFLLKLLQEQEITGPVAFDWEMHEPTYRAHETPPDMATACAVAFCQRIQEAGYEPMIYTSQYANYLLYDQEAVEPYGRWYPEYKSPSSTELFPGLIYQPDFWQFSDSCQVDGIAGPVDGNLRFLIP